MSALRVRASLLPSGAQSESARIRDLVSRLDDKVDLRPTYQRDIRWGRDKMNELIATVMRNGLIPGLITYKLQAGDERAKPSHRWECIDGQHRIFTLSHFLLGRPVSLDGKEFMLCWVHVAEDKSETHVFYEENEDTKRWAARFPSHRFDYMTEDEKDAFADFKLEIKEIRDPLTLAQRCQIFTSLQQGVQVRNSDLLKNFTDVRLVHFIQYEKKWEAPFKAAMLAHCHLKAKNYWLNWVIRCYLMLFPISYDEAADGFKVRDSKITDMIKKNDPRLNSPADQEKEFETAMTRFLSFLDTLPPGVRFSPAKFFALFQHLAIAEDGREDLLSGHMAGWAADLPSKEFKTAWENRKKGDDDEERALMFEAQVEELDRIKIPAQEIPERKTIPKKLRNRVWANFFGEETEGVCWCCEESIEVDAWECGHILAAASGGKDHEANLRPVCRGCNRSMGTMHMDDFKKQFYSK